MNLAGALAELAGREGWGDRIAYRAPGRSFTHAHVHAGAAAAAGLLARLGVVHGDRVVLALGDRIEFVWAFLGAVRLGAIAVPVDPGLAARDHAYVLSDTAPAAVVCDDELAERFEGAPEVVRADRLEGLLDRSGTGPAPLEVPAAAPAYGQYTSGTTGDPKLALHRHGDIPTCHQAGAAALGLEPSDVLLSPAGLWSAAGLGAGLVMPLSSGAGALLPGRGLGGASRWEPRAVLGDTPPEPTILLAAPTWWAGLLAAAPFSPFSRLRLAVSAGETLTTGLAERIAAWTGCPVRNALVSTEVGGLFCCTDTAQAPPAGAVGRPLAPYEIRVCGTTGDEVPPGATGLLWVRGPTVLIEYLGKPESTARTLVDGWLRTGDLAAVDEDGVVHHRGRADDIEILRGMSVSPVEIERVLAGHIGVAEVAVAAVRDEQGASSLRAFVVPTDPGRVGDALADSIIALAAERLAPAKVPESVVFVAELPRTATGQLRRFLLREAGEELTSAGA
jgi:fatty-acyl-CoA synthase/fatty acid CoA ligase FadD22